MRSFLAARMRRMALIKVVFPTPGPPVITSTLLARACSTAAFWLAASSRPRRCSTQGMALAASIASPGRAALRQRLKSRRDAPLIAVQVGKEDRRLTGQGVDHHRALGQLQIEGALDQAALHRHPTGGAGLIKRSARPLHGQ